jgi:hypothetical protein
MTRLCSARFPLRASAAKLSFGVAGLRLRSATALRASAAKSSFGAATSARSLVRRAIETVTATVAAVLIGGATSVFACPLCFGAQETPLIDGAKLGVLVMLGVLFAVQGAFVAFFLYLRKRAKENADVELDMEWLELQRGSRTP